MRSSIAIPLVSDGRPSGVITFASREPNAYTPAHAALLGAVSGQLAVIIERERLISRLRADNRRLRRANELERQFAERLREEVDRRTADIRRAGEEQRLLLGIARSIHATLDLESVFRTLVDSLRELVDFRRAGILLLDPNQSVLRFRGLRPASSRQLGVESRIPVDGSAAGAAIRGRRPVVARDIQTSRRFYEDTFLALDGIGSHVNVPLFVRERAIGTLAIGSTDAAGFSRDTVAFLERLAELLSAAVANAEAHGEVSRSRERLEEENVQLREVASRSPEPGHAVGDSPAWRRLMEQVAAVAPTDATVLVAGETGSGKEVVARAIHRLSPRSEKPFVAVNCGALTDELVASELFGHEQGAFTGAHERRLGRLEIAEGGTLFLDEVGELSLAMQVKLLRVLQEREFERVGGTATLRANVRVVAATNRDLEAARRAGRFRDDLYYRLDVFPLRVPPLRERPEDVEPLVLFFVDRHARRVGRRYEGVDPESLERCRSYAWPGNVRELENVIERSVILCADRTFRIEGGLLERPGASRGGSRTFDESVREVLADGLRRAGGKIYGPGGAAELLALKPSTLQAKLEKYSIDRREFAGR